MGADAQGEAALGLRADGDIDWHRIRAPFYMRQLYVALYLAYISYAGGIADGLLPLPALIAGLAIYCLLTARLFFKLKRVGLTSGITRLAMRQDLLMLGLGYVHDPYASAPSVVAGLVILLGNGLRHGPDYYRESALAYLGIVIGAAWLRQNYTEIGYPAEAGATAIFTIISIIYGQFLVSRLWQSRQALLRNSRRDDVTGLLTRRAFRSLADSFLQNGLGNAGSLLYLDLDRFKQVNDRFGHAAGDAALLAIAEVIEKLSAERALCCRYGGDEFVIFSPSMSRMQADNLATMLEQEIHNLSSRWDGSELGVSIGLAVAPDDAEDFDGLLEHADRDMYRAKKSG